MPARILRAWAYPHRVAETVAWERATAAAAGVAYEFLDAPVLERHAATIATADAIVAGGGRWDADAFALASRCRLFLFCGVGLDAVDVAAASRCGIAVGHMPDVCTHEVAEHTFALLLAVVRKVARLDAQVHGGSWSRELLEPMGRLHGRTLGLIGLGRIARAVALPATAFGMRVVAHDPYADAAGAQQAGIELLSLERLCRDADVISCHVPLTDATRGIVGARELAWMKPSAIVVNTSRGGLVDEAELSTALREGRIRGAALDVLATEPPLAGSPLLGRADVVLTPHAGGFSDEVVDEIPRRAMAEILRVLGGELPSAGAWANADALGLRVRAQAANPAEARDGG